MFTLKLDGVVVGQQYQPSFVSQANSAYKKLSGRVTIVGDGPHVLSLEVETMGTQNAWTFDADDFEIKANKGPDGQRLCAASTP